MTKYMLAAMLVSFAIGAHAAVDANEGSVAELDAIKGIGPATSGEIVAARKSGNFQDWTDLIARVPGIAASRAAKLSAAGLTVNGRPFEPAASKARSGKSDSGAAAGKF